jgi:hypothetical protein
MNGTMSEHEDFSTELVNGDDRILVYKTYLLMDCCYACSLPT